jgi:tetratricopeptide (TPR) repeat protein
MTLRSDGAGGLRDSRSAQRALAALVLGLAVLAAYYRSLSGALVFDDQSTIIENTSIRRLWSLKSVLSPPPEAGICGRPFANFTMALNYSVSGLDPRSYHAVNLLIHVLATLTLFGVVRRTLLCAPCRGLLAGDGADRSGPANEESPASSLLQRNAFLVALGAALLWAVHPQQTNVVDYLSQRVEGLMGLCFLLTLYCFIRGTECQPSQDRQGRSSSSDGQIRDSSRDNPSGLRRRIWFMLSFAVCLLGMASKEVMVTAPVMIFLYDRTFISGTFALAWRQRWRLHVALAATWFLLAYLMTGANLAHRGIGYSLGVSTFDYALTECRAILNYLRLAVWPHPLVFDYGWDLLTSLKAAAPYVLGLGALVAGTLYALGRRPMLGFAGAWFLGILAPSSSVVPIIQQPAAESRIYLPLAAITTLATIGLWRLAGRRSLPALLAAAVAFGGMTVRRNADYHSELVLWSDTVAHRPENARAHNNLGGALLRAGRLTEAVEQLEFALRLAPAYPDAHNNLGVALAQTGRIPEAITHYQAALRANPGFTDAHYNLGNALVTAGRLPEAIDEFEATLRIDPDHARAHNDLGVVLLEGGWIAEALAHNEAALRIQPDFAEAHYNLGNALVRIGRIPEACAQYEAALRFEPDFAKAHNNLGALLLQTGRIPKAVAHFEAALRIQPDYPDARRNLDHARRLQNP